MSRLPISRKRPPGARMTGSSPGTARTSELSTTSTPRPSSSTARCRQIERSRIEHVFDAEFVQIMALFMVSRRCQNFGAAHLARSLMAASPTPPAARMHQHPLRHFAVGRGSRAHDGPSQTQPVPLRRQRTRGQRGIENTASVATTMCDAEAARESWRRPAGRSDLRHARSPTADDHAGTFEAEVLPGRPILGARRQQPGHRHHVAEIQADSTHLDQHFAGFRLWAARSPISRQVLDQARSAHRHA